MTPFEILKNADEVHKQFAKLNEGLDKVEITGSAGGNIVNVTLNGRMELVGVHIDPIAVDARDVKMLEDLIVSAAHDAMDKLQEELRGHYSNLLSDMIRGE